MTGTEGMLAAAVLKAAAGKVAAAAGDRIMLQWRFSKDLEYMRDTLESIESVLEDAERRSVEDKSVQLWLERLTRASYDISDMFDEFEVHTTRKSALQKFKVPKSVLIFPSAVGMASKMKKVREKLENISNERHKYSFTTSSSSNVQQIIHERATSSEVIEEEILGRDGEKQKLMYLLTSGSTSSGLIILPIYGIGGIGKTTLAQMIFNDTHFKDYEKAWVYVSQTFDLIKIKKSISSQLQMEQGQVSDTKEQDAGPSARKNILIVLDDLWEEDDFKLDDLKKSLKIVGHGHRVHVIVTTRDSSIAEKVQTIEAHKIEALSLDVCWTIIKQIVGFEKRSDKERLEVIGKEIAEKCEGVALAARAIGYILRSRRDFQGWVSVKDNGIWNVSSPGSSPYDNVLASLKLSYSSMLPHLRLCFVYCAVFPKGHKMPKYELIYQWAALGFIKPSDEFPTWQHGEDCIEQLLQMSFLEHSKSRSPSDEFPTWQHGENCIEQLLQISFPEHSKSRSIDRKHGKDVALFTMHDLVHDLATSIMADGFFDATKNFKFGGSNCRYAFLADFRKPLNSFITYPDQIRAIRFLGSGDTGHCCIGFSTAKYLRVLDLGESSLKKLPSSIGQLKVLRYLNAPGIKGRVIPSCITKLSKLIYLSLRGSSNISTLPKSFGEMEALMYLDLSGCSGIKKLPESFGKLGSLVHLDLSGCSPINVIPKVLRCLTKLQYLNLSWLPLWKLQEPVLQELHKVMDTLIELRYLSLSSSLGDVPSGTIIDILDCISTLPNLEHLDLSGNRTIEVIPDSICSLRKLHTLDLSGCIGLKELPGNMGRMESLKLLIADDCDYLDLFTPIMNKNLIHLPNFVVHVAEGEQSSNLILLKDVSPTVLRISRLENVKSVEEARRIEVRKKQSMEELTLDWTRGTKRFVEDTELLRELMPPNSLKRFVLKGYNSVSFPAWLLTGIAIYLPNLKIVTLTGLSRCSSLPPLGQLPNLFELCLEAMPGITKISKNFCGDGMKAFSQLTTLTISDMENLEEWSTTYSYSGDGKADEFMFPNLVDLKIISCRKLRVGPCPPRVKRTWSIKNSDRVLTQWEEGAPHAVRSISSAPVEPFLLEVESCTAPMHQWKLLHHLPALRHLKIYDCNDLTSSPEVTRALAPLQSLTLWSCSDGMPQWLGDLVSLNKLEIWFCQGFTSSPDIIKQLTNLESLTIEGCPELSICLEENKTMIDIIKQLTNLESLTIEGCPELSICLEENKTMINHIEEAGVLPLIKMPLIKRERPAPECSRYSLRDDKS